MSTISVRTSFAAGHRILGLSGLGEKCRNVHGHTFTVTWVLAQHESLEFTELKTRLKTMIYAHFDHAFILDKRDDFCTYLKANDLRRYELDGPPTTEAIAAEIARLTIERMTRPIPAEGPYRKEELPALWPEVKLLRVVLEEGPNNTATWENEITAKQAFEMAGVDYDAATQGRWAATTVVAGGPEVNPSP